MNYVISDIHNDNNRLKAMLKKISFNEDDHLYVLGDLFDRGGSVADPLGVYFTLLRIKDRCTFIRGNHDTWLAEYIYEYYRMPKKKLKNLRSYPYNSFGLLTERLPEADMIKLADTIMSWPVQVVKKIGDTEYIFAHAMSSASDDIKEDNYYLMGNDIDFMYLRNGIEGATVVNGHNHTSTIREWYGDEYKPKKNEVWHNPQENLYMIDCGCGFSVGRLACLRLEDKEEFYI